MHFATAEDLHAVFPPADADHLRLGHLSAAEEVPVCLDVGLLVLRHAAVVGSTGAGKTSAVATLLQGFVRGGWTDANIVVIDPHGEYSRSLEDHAAVRSVLASGESLLHVPYWALAASDILRVFAGSTGGPTTTKRFSELVRQSRQEFATTAAWLHLDPAAITADTPVPFDINAVWFKLDYENNETRDVKTDESTVRIEAPGNADTLTPTRFTPYGAGGAIPNQGPMFAMHGSVPELLRLGLQDARLQFSSGAPGTRPGTMIPS